MGELVREMAQMCALCALRFLLVCISHEEVDCTGGVISRPFNKLPRQAGAGRAGSAGLVMRFGKWLKCAHYAH
jgi:hypothetical protein